ncbi:MAG TPA: type I polyketide synthase, partial [Solirubrobacterales bacterium]
MAQRYPDLKVLLATIEEGVEAPDLLLIGAPCPHAKVPKAAAAAAEDLLGLLQQFLAAEPLAATRLVVVTEGALAAADGEVSDPRLAPALGLLRSAASEHPGRFCAVDLDGSEASLGALPAALGTGETELALREGRASVARASRAKLLAAGEEAPVLDPERLVLITGATGGLGTLVAKHLVKEHGARRLLLVSRRGPEASGAEELESELRELGASEVNIARCDVTSRKALADLLQKTGELGAVIHAAGVLADSMVAGMDEEQLRRVVGPKIKGAWHLHELTRGSDLTHFVLFSSIAGMLGTPGQGNYAAGNNFLDSLAAFRRAEGLPATSLAWGLWGETGMGGALDDRARARLERFGLRPLRDDLGLAMLDACLQRSEAVLVPVQLQPQTAGGLGEGAPQPLLEDLVRTSTRRSAQGSFAQRLARIPEVEREEFALEMVRFQVAAVLGHSSSERVDPEKSFKNQGFDSLAAVELRNRLAEVTGIRLGATSVFDYPTPKALAARLQEEGRPAAARISTRSAIASPSEPIAIVGMACRFPGAESPEELWRIVAEGRDAVAPFPVNRGWDLERLYNSNPEAAGTSYVREGGFLADLGGFDADFFEISAREALAMDPQQRLLLEVAWEALEAAGVEPDRLRSAPVGVFAGAGPSDYPVDMRSSHEAAEGFRLTGSTGSVLSGRVAYALGLEG